MRYLSILVGLAPVIGYGQTSTAVQTWARDHFGVQIEFPTTSVVQNFGRVAQSDGTYVYQPDGPARSYNDPNCKPWQDAYTTLAILPRGAWVRTAVNLWEHYPAPGVATVDNDRFLAAITGKVLYPNLPVTTDGLNLIWELTPGIPPRYSNNDGWFDNPLNRDWYKPVAANHPGLKISVQSFVTAVNNYSVAQARVVTPARITTNIVARMGFQLGNEIGAAHPGGSVYGNVGSWAGMGQVMEDTTKGISWRPDSNNTKYLAGGTSWINPLNLPAFSFGTEAREQAFVWPTLYGQVKSIQWPGATVPGLTEVFSYYDEMFGPSNSYGWATQCTRKSIHFRSPILHWLRGNDGQAMIVPDLNSDNSLNGRWESAPEYAKRWADEVALAIKGYSRLTTPGSQPVIDLTECYLTYGELNSQILDPSTYQFVVNGVAKTTDQIRIDALQRGSSRFVNGVTYNAPLQPSRISILAAIRDELYNRSKAGQLANLGHIFWVNAYSADPRRETGFNNTDPINFYSPWADFRLTNDEIKTIFGKL